MQEQRAQAISRAVFLRNLTALHTGIKSHEVQLWGQPARLAFALRPAAEADEDLDDDEAAAAGERLNAVYERLQEMGSATAEARAAKILHGLGAIRNITSVASPDAASSPRPAPAHVVQVHV